MTKPDRFHDENVEVVIAKIRQRSIDGQKAHGNNTEREDYDLRAWLLEGQEEAIDLSVYLQAAINKLPEVVDPNRTAADYQADAHRFTTLIGPQGGYYKAMAKAETSGQLARRVENLARLTRQHRTEIAGLLKQLKEPREKKPCAHCVYLQNQIDRHECRTYVGSLRFYQYLANFELTEHYERWDIMNRGQEEGEV